MELLTGNSNQCGCQSSEPDIKNSPGMATSGVTLMPAMAKNDGPCCGTPVPANPMASHTIPGYSIDNYVDRFMDTPIGPVPVIRTGWDMKDFTSTFIVRCGIDRYSYTVSPGLYAVGTPDKNSEVLVTANFKLTFDHLRKELDGIHAWILVLDTRGINVWCAAGEGTFSTDELVNRIKTSRLGEVVEHRRVIVPQLGATGVSARDVKKASGFRVVYGPVRAEDIPEYLKNHRKADKEMRQVTFTLYERFILTPVEIQIVLKPALITALIVFILSGIGPGIFSFSSLWHSGIAGFLALVTGILSGALVTPVLLPWLPFRQFAIKGIITGAVFALFIVGAMVSAPGIDTNGVSGATALFLFTVVISSFLAMNFTGTTPFTSPSGVELEMKRFIPVQLVGLTLSTGLWIYSAF